MSDAMTDRLGLERLGREECWSFLSQHRLGRVSIVQFDQPMIYPVNYALDGETVVFRSRPGSKMNAAIIGSAAAFEVDEADELFETGQSVVVRGMLRRVTDPAERERLEQLPLRNWSPETPDHFVRLLPTQISGRRIPEPPLPDSVEVDEG